MSSASMAWQERARPGMEVTQARHGTEVARHGSMVRRELRHRRSTAQRRRKKCMARVKHDTPIDGRGMARQGRGPGTGKAQKRHGKAQAEEGTARQRNGTAPNMHAHKHICKHPNPFACRPARADTLAGARAHSRKNVNARVHAIELVHAHRKGGERSFGNGACVAAAASLHTCGRLCVCGMYVCACMRVQACLHVYLDEA